MILKSGATVLRSRRLVEAGAVSLVFPADRKGRNMRPFPVGMGGRSARSREGSGCPGGLNTFG